MGDFNTGNDIGTGEGRQRFLRRLVPNPDDAGTDQEQQRFGGNNARPLQYPYGNSEPQANLGPTSTGAEARKSTISSRMKDLQAPTAPPSLTLPGISSPLAPPTIATALGSPRPPKLLQRPSSPQMNSKYATVQADLRAAEKRLDRSDPKYRLGGRGRVGRALSDVLGYGITGAARAALDPTAPGYYGRGAVNNRFAQDEAERQKRIVADKGQAASMESEFNQAEKGYRNEIQAYQDAQEQPIQPSIAQPATTSPASAPAFNDGTQTPAHEELNRFNQPPVAQSSAAVPAATTAGQKQPTQKIVTQAQILVLARKHKVPFADALKQFRDKGYVIK